MQSLCRSIQLTSKALGLRCCETSKADRQVVSPPVILTLGSKATKGVALLELNRPTRKNALSEQSVRQIISSLKMVESHPGSTSLVMTGRGNEYYTSGNDLQNFLRIGWPRDLSRRACKLMFEYVEAHYTFRHPLVVAANGHTIGIGVTVMGLCDARFSVPDATFVTPFKQLAQSPEGCSSLRFPQLMGPKMARSILDDGRKVTAKELLETGFLDELVNREELTSKAMQCAAEMATKGRRLYEGQADDFIYMLKAVNRREANALEKAFLSREAFEALEKFFVDRKKLNAARALKAVGLLRPIWDR